MAKAIDIEAEIPIHVVQLDGMVSVLLPGHGIRDLNDHNVGCDKNNKTRTRSTLDDSAWAFVGP